MQIENSIFMGAKILITRTTISLSIDEIGQLKKLAKTEHRPLNRQIIHMMEFYVKKHIEQ
jgi:hypothetical protein